MRENEWLLEKFLAEQFEAKRSHLRAVAYRMLGSVSEADDAVQEAWLRLSRAGASDIENLGAWLTTVVARICLDMLRSRTRRAEDSMSEPVTGSIANSAVDPEQEALLAESVGLALLVVLDRLAPAERIAFVLHDVFAVPFDEIAGILGHSSDSARQLASRARRRVRGMDSVPKPDLAPQREVAETFLAALRSGNIQSLIAVLDPDVVVHLDSAAAAPGAPREIRGAENWARRTVALARSFRSVQPALINGDVGLVWAPGGRLFRVLRLQISDRKIVRVNVIGDPAHLRELDIAALEG